MESRWQANGMQKPTTREWQITNQASRQIHYLSGREQLVRLGHEPAAAKGRIQVEASDAHRRASNKAERIKTRRSAGS